MGMMQRQRGWQKDTQRFAETRGAKTSLSIYASPLQGLVKPGGKRGAAGGREGGAGWGWKSYVENLVEGF